jgi:hypothetical protein
VRGVSTRPARSTSLSRKPLAPARRASYQALIASVTLLLLVLTVSRLYASARSPQPIMSATASASPSALTGASIGSPESHR